MKKKWLVVVLVLLVLGAVASQGRKVQQKADAPSTEERVQSWRQGLLKDWAELHGDDDYLIEATPDLMCQAYARNEVAANRDYKGKWVRLSGRIGSISSGSGGKPYLTFNVGIVDQVQAHLYKMQVGQFNADKTFSAVPAADMAAGLTPGQAVVLECRGQGATLGIPQLDLCLITPGS